MSNDRETKMLMHEIVEAIVSVPVRGLDVFAGEGFVSTRRARIMAKRLIQNLARHNAIHRLAKVRAR